jgi:titin
MDNGIEISGATTSGNRIEGNLIGTIVGGSGARPNQNHGVLVENAPNTVIGGTAAGARNVISGNGGSGVRLNSAGATGTVIAGNTSASRLTPSPDCPIKPVAFASARMRRAT